MISSSFRAAGLSGLMALGLICVSSHNAAAQTLLRWKFQEGEQLRYTMDQQTTTSMKFGNQDIQQKMTQVMDMTWRVRRIDERGHAEIAQTVDRIRLSMDGPPPIGSFQYDSRSGKEPQGPLAKSMVAGFTAMLGSEFVMKVNDRFQVLDVQIPDKMVAKLGATPGAENMGQLFSEEGFKEMLSQSTGLLPEGPVSKSDTWQATVEMKMPFGVMKIETNFVYQGPETSSARQLEKIDVTTDMEIEPSKTAQFQVKIASQDATGTMYFDNQAGRLEESVFTQKMVQELSTMGQAFEQHIDQKVTFKRATGESD